MKKNIKNLNYVWMIYLYDVVVVLAFVGLAISFTKWWIALFGLLFIIIPSYKKIEYYRLCDNCGKRSPGAETYNDAIDKAVSSGWLHRPKKRIDGSDNFEDFCPDCRRKLGLY